MQLCLRVSPGTLSLFSPPLRQLLTHIAIEEHREQAPTAINALGRLLDELQQSKRDLAGAIINQSNSLISDLTRDDLDVLLS